MTTERSTLWDAFREVNRRRRAVRDFDGVAIPDDDVRAVLAEAVLAPSSGNLQPYQFHWVRDPERKARVAEACNAQRAAASASTLIVVTADPRIGRRTLSQHWRHLEASPASTAESRAYHRAQTNKFARFLRVAPWIVWSPVRALLASLAPTLALLPLGPSGIRNWAARNALYAAQTLLLAAAAKGIDSCPMEGFRAAKVARLLGLPRGAVVPLVIALGYRRGDALIEPQWRREPHEAVLEHP